MSNPYTQSAAARRFHSFNDAIGSAVQPILRGSTSVQTVQIVRDLSYRCYPHFHPYVNKLTKRLVEGSIRGLQDTDTEYVANADGTLKSLPNSTLLTLASDIAGNLVGGAVITVVKDTPVTLDDGTFLVLPSNKQTTLPGDLMLTEPRAIRFRTLPDGTETVAFGTGLRLTAATDVVLPNGSIVKLPANTGLTLRACKPLPKLYEGNFPLAYKPTALVRRPYPVKDLDFTFSGAYSVYNWELFFHVPLTIAIHLSRNQRFEEAMRWFHFVFDPTDDSDGPTPERFWKVKPFQFTDVKLIEETLINLSTGADAVLQQETVAAIRAWKDAPFRPHLVARYRPPAYMLKTVMAYLDNLIAWADSLFREDTGESITEASQLYVLAASILGPRPQAVPRQDTTRPRTYANLKKDLDEFGNALVKLESEIPFNFLPQPDEANTLDQLTTTLRSVGNALYFCVPRNDKLLSYWDTVADRLFKIRNSLNILGIFRQLPLFEPPIDPALLAKAAAAGLDVGAVVSGINQPLPLVRFPVLLRHAAEISQEVKALGSNLLAAMEKEDGEAMAVLRIKHERLVMPMVEQVKYGQLQEALKSKEALLRSLSAAMQRYTYYERQLGKKSEEITTHVLGELDRESLAKMNLTTFEPELAPRGIEIDIATGTPVPGFGGRIFSSHEKAELEAAERASESRRAAISQDMLAKVLGLIPEVAANFMPLGLGPGVQFGGRALSAFHSYSADENRGDAEFAENEARRSGKIAGFARREQDWAFLSNLAVGEINQIFKQFRAAEIRQAIAELDLKTHRKQMEQAEEIERFLNEEGTEKTGKKTNQALYAWLKREVKGLYAQIFQLAFDIARKAERALQHELGNPSLSFLEFGYLAGKEGLLAGDKLALDIKRMEMAYHELNQREYELTKHVSLLQVDSLALVQLRATGRCTIRLNENLFDMDGPGHYFRRLKSVALSIPCVTGPLAGVNCSLTLLKSSIRKTQILRDGKFYERLGAEDDRFNDYFGSLQSIVTSSAHEDSGLFEMNLHEERYLPFENSGVISEWQLELPGNPSKDDPLQFDYDTISDVILHVRYTAREGGGLLRKGAMESLRKAIETAQAVGSVRLFSIRHDFSAAWAKFKSAPAGSIAQLKLELRSEHYPFWSRGRLEKVKHLELLASQPLQVRYEPSASAPVKATLGPDLSFGKILRASLSNENGELTEKPTGELKIFLNDNSITDLFLAVTWQKAS